MPSQTFTHEATTSAAPDQVWQALDRPDTWQAIGGVDRIFDPSLDSEGRLRGFSFETTAAGRTYVGEATPHERVEGETMAWRISNAEVSGLTRVSLTQSDRGTTISVSLHVESTGFLSSMFFPVIAGAIGGGLPRTVEEFAAGLS